MDLQYDRARQWRGAPSRLAPLPWNSIAASSQAFVTLGSDKPTNRR